MPVISNRSRVSLIVALILVGLLLSMYWAGRLAEQRAWAERGQESQGQLELYAQAIHTQVERFRPFASVANACISNRSRVSLIVALILVGLLLSMYWAGRLAEQRAWAERGQESQGQLELYAQAIHTQVERFRSVPALLALDSDIRHYSPTRATASCAASSTSGEQQNHAAGSSVLYLLDRNGETIAASNWRDWSSFVGNNYAFRPYFRDAVANGSGRYFAVGVTTGIPGYFLSSSVKNAAGELLGVLVVKLELEDMQRDWVGQPGILLIADSLDIVILTNRPAWRFRPAPAERRGAQPVGGCAPLCRADPAAAAEQPGAAARRGQRAPRWTARMAAASTSGSVWHCPRKTGPCTCCMTRSRSPPVCAAIAPRPAYG